MYKIIDGANDYLPAECYNFNLLTDKLLNCFIQRGFKRVDTPILERHELFAKPECGADINSMFKLTDYDGALLVMRPDMTMPIARLATTKINNAANMKFCYAAKSFSFDKGSSSALREYMQAGVELFSADNAYVDADSIALAIEALKSSGLSEFQIEVGHVGYFKGLLAALNLSADESKELIKLVNSKDKFGLEMFIKNRDDSECCSKIAGLPLQFGGSEILRELLAATEIEESKKAIENLIEIDGYINELGYGDYISYDLSLVNGVSYYSGVVFKGITKYFGKPVLSGGRYDKLCNAFDKEMPATGFAIGVDNLLSAVRRSGNLYRNEPKIDYYIGGSRSQALKIKNLIDDYLKQGAIAENSYISDKSEFVKKVEEIKPIKHVFVEENGDIIYG